MGNFIRSIVVALGSKRFAAALAAALTALLTALLTVASAMVLKRFGWQLTPDQIGRAVAWAVGIVTAPLVAYIFSQWHIDVASKGMTTTAFATANQVAKVVEAATADAKDGPLAVVREVAKVVEAATDPEDALAPPLPVTPVSPAAAAAVPSAPPAS